MEPQKHYFHFLLIHDKFVKLNNDIPIKINNAGIIILIFFIIISLLLPGYDQSGTISARDIVFKQIIALYLYICPIDYVCRIEIRIFISINSPRAGYFHKLIAACSFLSCTIPLCKYTSFYIKLF